MKKIIYAWMLFSSMSMFLFIKNYKGEEPVDIVTAFVNDRYINTDSTVTAAAFYDNEYMTDLEKQELIKNVAEQIGLLEPYDMTEEITENGEKYIISKTGTQVATRVELVTVENQINEYMSTESQYLLVSLEIANSLESAVYYRDKLENVFEAMNLSPDVSMYLKGNIGGELSRTEKNQIADHIIQELGGDIVTQNRSDEIFTVYAYTEAIEDYVVYGTTKTNINVVITYNEVSGMTEVYMATPILNQDY